MQRGGEPGNTAVDTGRNPIAIGTGDPITQNQLTLSSLTVKEKNVQTRKPLTQEEFKKQQQALRAKQIAAAQAEAEKENAAAKAAEAAAGARNKAEAAKEDEEQEKNQEEAVNLLRRGVGQGRQPFSNDMRHGFGGPIDDTSTAVTTTSPLSADHAPAAVTTASPPAAVSLAAPGAASTASPPAASTISDNIKNMSPEEKVAYFTQNALKRNESLQEADRRITLLAKSIPNAIWGKLGSIGRDSQKKLADGEVLNEFIGDLSEIIKDSEDQVAIVREYNRLLTEEITDIYEETKANGGKLTEEHIEHIHELQGIIIKNNEIIKRLTIAPSQLFHAMQTGNIDVLESQFGTQPGMPGNGSSEPKKGFFSGKNKGNSVTRGTPAETPPGTPPGTSQAIDGNTSKKPNIFKRMGEKFSRSFTRKKPTLEEEAKQKAIEEGRQKHINEQKALDKANRLRRDKSGLIPAGVKTKFSNMGKTVKTGVSNMGQAVKTGFSNAGQAVKSGVSNMGQAVKTKFSNMGQAVKTKFGNATQKFSKNNSKNDSEKLLSNSERSDDTANKEQKKSFRERLVNMKQSASARFTRKNRGTENPESEKTGLLSNDKKIEMQNIEPTPLPSQPTTPAAPGAAPPRPAPAERPEELKRAIQTRKAAAAPAETPTPTPVPSRPTSFSALSQQATRNDLDDFADYKPTRPMVNINPIAPIAKPASVPLLQPPPPPTQSRIRSSSPSADKDLIILGGGGNKTRKNGQYMREIKDNRTHLFNKEMQILNSIRNFKHGHIDNDNTKKQFMKAVKRG